MHQKDDADRRHNQRLFQQGTLQSVDGAVDQFRPVVHRLYAHTLGQARANLGDFVLDIGNDFQRVLAVARHDNARDHFTFAVEFGDAASTLGCEFDLRHVTNQHRRAALAFEYQHLDVAFATQVAFAAHHVLGFSHFHRAATHVAVGVADHFSHFGQRDIVSAQFDRVHCHLVGLHKAAHRGHFGHPVRLGQLVAHIPVLHAAQFSQRLFFGDQGVLVNPADPGGIGANLRRDATRHAASGKVQILQHPRTRPVNVGTVFKDDVNKRRTKKRKAAHHFRLRHGQHGCRQWIGHLVFHHLRRLTRVFGINNDLHVRQIGQRVDGRAQHGKHATDDDEQRGQQHQKAVAPRPVDDF